jgi:putative selenium metabolism hydrolase
MNYEAIRKQAAKYEKTMVKFLREMVAIPSESAQEKGVLDRIEKELKATGAYDKIWRDGLGNLLAQVGKGPRLLAIDAHVDTVGVEPRHEWKHDPYKGKVADGMVWGRGAGDQEGAIPAMVYAGKIIKDLGLRSDEWSLLLTFTVMEEDCDGLCWQYIVQEDKIRPECVIVTDSTNCKVLRGQRGRMEIGVTIDGKSCHGSMPEKGDNPVYKMARLVLEIEKLNERLAKDKFLGKGTITVSHISSQSPSLCAVPGQAYIHLDRRVTTGETKELAIKQIKDLLKSLGIPGKVELLRYKRPSYTGKVYETDSYFPTWVYEEDAPQVKGAIQTHERLFGKRPEVSRWTFSTNGVSIAGMYGIPSVGFGPAEESVAHTINDRVPIEHLTRCAAMYAAFPNTYCEINPKAPAAKGAKKSAAEKPAAKKPAAKKKASKAGK